jgi:hypothetical protein
MYSNHNPYFIESHDKHKIYLELWIDIIFNFNQS